MADKITGYTFDRMRVTPQNDAMLYESLAGHKFNYVINGYKNNMYITAQNLTLTVDTGAAVIYGRVVEILEPMQITVPANYRGFLAITVDLTKTNTSTGTPGQADYLPVNNQVYLSVVDNLVTQDLNNGGQIYQFALAALVTNGNTITLGRANENRVDIKFLDSSPWKPYYDGEYSVSAWKIGEWVAYSGYMTLKTGLAAGAAADAFLIPDHVRPGYSSIDFTCYTSKRLYNVYANIGAKKMIIGNIWDFDKKDWFTSNQGWFTLNNIFYPSGDYRAAPEQFKV